MVRVWDPAQRILHWGFIAAHVAGVVFTSRRHRENLVQAMFSGRKPAHVAQGIQGDERTP